MTTIDHKVVEMAFENAQFEKGVGTSLSSIDRLKKSLNFDHAAKGFSGITEAANKVNLGAISDGVNHISSRFSAMGVVAITTLVNIANSAYQAAAQIVKSLTIDPIKAGLDEYETKLNSIQTILANTQKEGTNLEQVTNALNELNAYSDKTIYNFQEMARNVGTFTSAGVKLDDSVAAIKGIANLAAISGSNAQQASTAMYQLSQALSSGTIRLMDWNSVVAAGMGGTVFQDAIIETARVHGVAIDQMLEQEGGFRNSLQKGWLTSEIMTETLQKFTGDLTEAQLKSMGYNEEQIAGIIKMGQTATDAAQKVKTFTQLLGTLRESAQSGWAQTWEIVLGNFDEAKAFFTETNDILGAMIGASADARNALLQSWKDLGGRQALIDSVRNAFHGVLSIIQPLKDALREIFPPVTAQQLFNLSKGLRDLTEKFKIGGEGADKLKRIFKGVFAIVDVGIMAVSAFAKAIFGVAGSLSPAVGSFTDLLARIGDIVVNFRDGIKATDAFNVAFTNIGKVLAPIISIVKNFFASFADGLGSFKGIKLDGLTTFMDNLQIRFEPLRQLATLTGKFLGLIGALVSKLAPTVLKLGSIVAEGLGNFIDRITLALNNFEPEKVFDIINGGLLAGVLMAIRKFINKGSGMFDGVKDVLDGVKGSLEAWQASLKADVLLKIAAALGILTLSVIALSMIDSKKLTTALTGMTAMFIQLGVSLGVFQKISATVNPLQMGVMAAGLLSISAAMLVMSLAISKLGTLSSNELMKGMLAIVTVIGVVKLTANALSKSSMQMVTGAAALIVFSFAIRSLSVAVRTLGELDLGALTKGLLGVGVLVTELALFMRATDLSGLGIIKSVGILVLAGAVNLLAIAVAKLAEIPTDGIAKGLLAMGLIFAELAAFMTLTAGGAGLILTAAGVVVISGAMLILAEVLERIGSLSWEEIAKGLTSIALALTLIGAAGYLIPPTLILQAAGLVVMAGALIVLADAMSVMGGMSWDEIARGVTVLGGSLLILVVALSAMSGTITGSAALFLAAAGLAVLAPALKTMGSMSLKEIGMGLLALAGTFVVLGVAAAVMTPTIPTLLGLGAAMLLIGVAAAGIGVGVLAFSAGLSALAVSGAAGAAALVVIITSIVGLIPMLVNTLGRALLTLVDVLVAGAPTLLEGVVTLLNILLDGLLEIGPKLVDVVITLVEKLLVALAEKIPTLVQAGYDIIISILEGARANIADVVKTGYDVIIAFLGGVSEKLPEVAQAGWDLIISWIDAMALAVEENIPRMMESVQKLGVAIVKGIIKGLFDSHAEARNSIKELGQILVDGFKSYLGIASPSTVFIKLAGDIVQGLINGIRNKFEAAKAVVVDLGNQIVQALKGKYDSMVSAGRDLVNGFGDGIRAYISQAVNAAAQLAASVLSAIKETLGISSPSKEAFELAKFVDQGLANGLVKYSGLVVSATQTVGNNVISGFTGVISRISDAVNSNMDVNPTIRPVIDLSAIESGNSKIENLLGKKKLNLAVAATNASRVSQIGQPLAETTNASQQTGKTPSVTFTQNNYSPKALSRIEIYRQTRNQLAQVKGLVGA